MAKKTGGNVQWFNKYLSYEVDNKNNLLICKVEKTKLDGDVETKTIDEEVYYFEQLTKLFQLRMERSFANGSDAFGNYILSESDKLCYTRRDMSEKQRAAKLEKSKLMYCYEGSNEIENPRNQFMY